MLQALSNPLAASFSVRLPSGIVCRILERPGLWQSVDEQTAIQSDLDTVAAAVGTSEPLTYGVFSKDPARFQDRLIAVAYEEENSKPIGFVAMPLLEVDIDGRSVRVVHLGLGMVDRRHQCAGIVSVLYELCWAFLLVRNRGRSLWFSNVSQIPRVIGAAYEHCDRVYPSPDTAARPTRAHRLIADAIMGHHRAAFGVAEEAEFDSERFVISNADTGGSDGLKKAYSSAIEHTDPCYNDLCRTHLDYARGDDFLQIGVCSIFTLVRSLARRALRCSSGRLLSGAGSIGSNPQAGATSLVSERTGSPGAAG
jgi:hypothetical protein